MAIPEPVDWSRAAARQSQLGDREILKVLRAATADVRAILRRGFPQGLGGQVREEQMRRVLKALLKRQSELMTRVGDITSARRLQAAAEAIKLGSAIDTALLAAAGRSEFAKALADAALIGLDRTVELAEARMAGASVPLAEKVYRNEVWLNGRLENLVNSALAQGLSAREFAAKAIGWFNPATPGGASYAAMRLARTEINNAFHHSSVLRASAVPWITGMKWHLSSSHPKPDLCDRYARGGPEGDGVYRKSDVPRKPHPHCFCYVTPEQLDEDEFLDNLVAGRYTNYINSIVRPSRSASAPQPVKSKTYAERASAARTGESALKAVPRGLPKRGSLSRPERAALRDYESSAFQGINGYLRRGGLPGARGAGRTVTEIDRAMDRSPTTSDLITYRGFQSGRKIFGDAIGNDLSGFEWRDDAYSSMTANEKIAFDFASGSLGRDDERFALRILLPRGSKAVQISGYEFGFGQAEILGERGMRFRVVRDRGYSPKGIRQLDVEVIPNGAERKGREAPGS